MTDLPVILAIKPIPANSQRRAGGIAGHVIDVPACGGSFVTSAFLFSVPSDAIPANAHDVAQRRARTTALLLHNLPAVTLFLQHYGDLNDYALEYLEALGKNEL